MKSPHKIILSNKLTWLLLQSPPWLPEKFSHEAVRWGSAKQPWALAGWLEAALAHGACQSLSGPRRVAGCEAQSPGRMQGASTWDRAPWPDTRNQSRVGRAYPWNGILAQSVRGALQRVLNTSRMIRAEEPRMGRQRPSREIIVYINKGGWCITCRGLFK